jgi:hypothetical protein
MIEADLKSFLATATGRNVYPLTLPQNTTDPAVVYERNGGIRNYTTDGAGTQKETHFQISAMASEYEDAKTLMETIESAVDGYSGVMGSTNVFLIVIATDSLDVYEHEAEKYRSTIFIEIKHET